MEVKNQVQFTNLFTQESRSYITIARGIKIEELMKAHYLRCRNSDRGSQRNGELFQEFPIRCHPHQHTCRNRGSHI